MSDVQPVSTLSTYTARTWAVGETIDAIDLNNGSAGEYFSIDALIDQLKNLLTDIQNCRATSNHTPTDNAIAGQFAFDTTLDQWFGDPDGLGADDEVLTRLKAYTIDNATAGTATFRAGGPLNVNTTDSARTTTGDFAQTYALPAGSLARNGQYVHVVWWGSRSGAVGTFSLAPYFGSAAGTAVASTINSLTYWIIELWVIRTGAATQDFAWKCSFNSDATGSTTLVSTGTLTETLSGAVTIKLNLSAISAGTVTQEGMLTEFGNI